MEPLKRTDPGRIGPYDLLARLGGGAMGEVFLARSRGGRPVVVKVVRPQLAGDPRFRAWFAREVAAVRAVGGIFTAPVLDADPLAARPWLATAYVPGPSLREAVDRHGPLAEEVVAGLGAALTEALGAIHRAGVVHRDIKPGNVLLAADGPRLIDFGLSGVVDEVSVPRGTPGYAAPEANPGPAGDVFGLGAVLVFAATGEGPFGDGPAMVLTYRAQAGRPDLTGVPESLRPVVAACLAPDPAQRPTPERLQRMLPHASAGWPEGVGAEITDRERTLAITLSGARRPRPGRRRVLGAGGAVALLGAAGIVAGVTAEARPRHHPRPRATPRPVSARPRWTAAHGLLADGVVVSGAAVFLEGADQTVARMSAVDVGTGKRLWSVRSSEPAAPGTGGPVTDGTVVYALLADLRLHALDPRTGRSRWSRGVAGLVLADVLGVLDGLVICKAVREFQPSDERLLALRPGARSPAWDVPYGAVTIPAGPGSLLFQGTTDGVRALDTTAATRWRTPVDDIVSNMTSGNAAVYLLGQHITALDAATGRRKWIFSPAGSPLNGDASMLATGGRLFVAGPHPMALDAATGRALWRREESADSGLCVAGGTVYAGLIDDFDTNGNVLGSAVHGYDAATGALRWIYRNGRDAKGTWRFCVGAGSLLASYEGTAAAFSLT